MRKNAFLFATFGAALLALASPAAAIDYMPSPPLSQVVKGGVVACSTQKELQVPIIAWGADMATIGANGNAERTVNGSLMKQAGLDAKLYRQDRFVQQVEDYLACRTPFLRGTIGMIAMAADVLGKDPRTRPVIIYQLSWSVGGDGLVVREGINSPADLKGKTIALQAYGPHVDYLATVLKSAGLTIADVNLKWVRDIADDGKSTTHSPTRALREDKSVDAVFVISPDAAALTGGPGKVGTGAEGSVKGARILFSTKTASRVIADVYVVRKDYFDANQAQIEKFVHVLMRSRESSVALVGAKDKQRAAYDAFMKASARMLLGAENLTEDAAGMWAIASEHEYDRHREAERRRRASPHHDGEGGGLDLSPRDPPPEQSRPVEREEEPARTETVSVRAEDPPAEARTPEPERETTERISVESEAPAREPEPEREAPTEAVSVEADPAPAPEPTQSDS